MTPKRVKELLPIIVAFSEGKQIQYKSTDLDMWIDCPGEEFNICDYEYRVKPEPSIRPWRPEEVPVGQIVRGKGYPFVSVIVKCEPDGKIELGGIESVFNPDNLLKNYEHSIDSGKTWTPCGIQEGV